MNIFAVLGMLFKYGILIYCVGIFLNDKIKISKVFLFLVCAIPYSSSVMSFFNLNFNLKVMSVNIVEFVFILLILIRGVNIFLKRRDKYNCTYVQFVVFAIINCIFLVSIFIGINNGLKFILLDIKRIMFYLFAFVLMFEDDNTEERLTTITLGMLCYSVLTILIFTFRNTLFYSIYSSTQWVDANRIGFTNIIFAIYLVANLRNVKKYKKIFIITIILNWICAIISQSITFIIVFAFITMVAICQSIKDRFTKGIPRKYVTGIIILSVLVMSISILSITYNRKFIKETILGSTIIEKLEKYSNGNLSSMLSRNITNEIALNNIDNKYIGDGLGTTFQTFIQNGQLAQENSLYVDNLYITALCKFGIIGSGILLICCILLVLNNVLNTKYNKYSKVMLLLCTGSLLAMGITTSHLITSPPLIIMFQLFMIENG